jgi:hypothetical protein
MPDALCAGLVTRVVMILDPVRSYQDHIHALWVKRVASKRSDGRVPMVAL